MEKIWLLESLRSNRFILAAAVFSVLWLSPNTYFVYYELCRFSSPYREIASIGSALIVSSFIMLYTLRKNYTVAKYYSFFEAFISAYYYISSIGIDWPLLPAMGFVFIFPLSLYNVTKELEKQPEEISPELIKPIAAMKEAIKPIVNAASIDINQHQQNTKAAYENQSIAIEQPPAIQEEKKTEVNNIIIESDQQPTITVNEENKNDKRSDFWYQR